MIEDRINNILEDLNMFDDDIDKYEYIVDVGKNLPNLDESLQRDEFLVKGCTSKVWLIAEYSNGVINLKADSNSVIVKGLASILITVFQDLEPEEIVNYNIDGLEKLGLTEIISPTRQNGVYHMVNKIKHYAELYKE
ncbi:SufE family protein [Thiospirochaeta perfilievii]|uniref:SufE family protein n=1 Tax=Thiospirochaeta perfilievii TaxID=252967 RepID=A0A5C1QA07_9SPIO|nr:SufE family protein [Thiospirochaeta perfilievii]QEN04973.1 SufE family protein [Thiospirochaeta perfilievii]